MPIGGKLVLKGGATLGGGVDKKKKKAKKQATTTTTTPNEQEQQPAAAGTAGAAAAAGDGGGAGPSSASREELPRDKLPTAYEKAFAIEARRMQQGNRERACAWGAGSYRAPPAVLHGRTAPIKGDTAEERLDLRSASKADRYCK